MHPNPHDPDPYGPYGPNQGYGQNPNQGYGQDPMMPAGKPGVLKFFYGYMVAIILLYLMIVAACGFFALAGADSMKGEDLFFIIFLGGACGVTTLAALPAFFLPRKKWGWVFSIIWICMGISSCFFPAALWLMIEYNKDEVKRYYNAL